MAKPLFQDIVPPEKRSIKRIPIPERERSTRRERPPERSDEPEPKSAPRRKTTKRSLFKPVITVIIALSLVGAGVYTFVPRVTGASIKLHLKGQPVSVDAQFAAAADQTAELPYQTAVYQKDGKLVVPATGEEVVHTKASGTIRIFNNYSSAPQILVASTRFESPDGKIFRITSNVTVPGKNGDTPGSVDATVTAEKTGDEYNVGMIDFTIPGFKGTPKYSKFFARSKTAIGGGFSGARKKIDQSLVVPAREKIRKELETSLLKQMEQNIPDDYVFLPNAYFIEFESLPDTAVDNGVALAERANFHGFMFKRQDIAQSIAQKAAGTLGDDIDLYGADTLRFETDAVASDKPWESKLVKFTLTGTTTLISKIDTEKLKTDLIRKPRQSLNAVLSGYPGIARAEITIRPFWKQAFPDNPAAIAIEIAPSPISP